MDEIVRDPLFGIALCVAVYLVGVWASRKLKSPLANPLLIAILLAILLLLGTGIPLEAFDRGGQVLTMLLAPATASLAVPIYRERAVLKKYFLPVALGCLAGAATSIASVWGLCRLFGLDEKLTASMLPKSVTTPIAMEVSKAAGGIPSVTVAAVIFTGILGAVLAPTLIRLFRIKNPVAAGVAIGACSHAIGTTRAIQLGEIQGAMSGIAIGLSGLTTVLLALFL